MKKIPKTISIAAATLMMGVFCLSQAPLHGSTVYFQDNFSSYNIGDSLTVAPPWISVQPGVVTEIVASGVDQHGYKPAESKVLRVKRTAAGTINGSTGTPNMDLYLRDVSVIDFSFQFRNMGAGPSVGSYVFLDTGTNTDNLAGIYFRDVAASSYLNNNGGVGNSATLSATSPGSNILALNTWYQADFQITVDHENKTIGYTVQVIQLSTGSIVATGFVESFTNKYVNMDGKVRVVISPQTDSADFEIANIVLRNAVIPEPSSLAFLTGLLAAGFLIVKRLRNRK